MNARVLLFIVAALAATSGCSTIVGERYNHVNIASTPQGAEFEVRRGADGAVVASGVTPNLVKLKSSAGYFKRGAYTVLFRKPGYSDLEVPLAAGMRGTYWGNILIGGPIGLLIVDPASGAMWALPRAITAELQPGSTVPLAPVVAESVVTSQPLQLSREQQVRELQETPGLSYEEYQRRYRLIEGQ